MTATSDVSRKSATFLLTSPTAPGHVLRVLDLAQQLTSRGHRVLFKAKASMAAEVKAAGAELLPYESMMDLEDIARILQNASLPFWMPRIPFAVAQFRSMVLSNSIQLVRELEPVLKRESVDCVVYDFFEFGAAWAAELAGIPYVSAGNMGTVIGKDDLPLMVGMLPATKHLTRIPALVHGLLDQLLPLNEGRKELGLPPYTGRTSRFIQALISPQLHIVMGHRGLAGDVPLRDRQVFAGPTAFNKVATGEQKTLKVEPGTVLISTTTTPKDDGLFRRVLEAVAPMNVPVLATSAGAQDIPAGLGSHIRIERYIPHDTVFPQVQALVTHGGWGTVGRALSTGLPMLVIPLFGDQLLNAELVERAGVGRRLPLAEATPERIRTELQKLLADEGIRARAKQTAAEIKQLKSDQVAAQALEQIALKGRGAAASARATAA